MSVVAALSIRPAGPADASAIAETVRQGFETYREWAPRGWEPPLPRVQFAGIRDRLGHPATWCVLAEAGGAAAGHAAITPVDAALAHLWMLFVRRPWWGTGLAADLLGRAVAEAGARGYTAIRLHTPAAHSRARAFYAREGWAPVGAPAYEPGLGLALVELRRDVPRSDAPCRDSAPRPPAR